MKSTGTLLVWLLHLSYLAAVVSSDASASSSEDPPDGHVTGNNTVSPVVLLEGVPASLLVNKPIDMKVVIIAPARFRLFQGDGMQLCIYTDVVYNKICGNPGGEWTVSIAGVFYSYGKIPKEILSLDPTLLVTYTKVFSINFDRYRVIRLRIQVAIEALDGTPLYSSDEAAVSIVDEMVALITGGAGLVGRHLTHRLCREGFTVIVVDDLQSEGAVTPSQWPHHLQCQDATKLIFIQQDCRDYFRKSIKDEFHRPIELFIHLASAGGGGEVDRDPLIVAGDLSLDGEAFSFLRVFRPSNVIYFSSSSVYPSAFQGEGGSEVLEEGMVDVSDITEKGWVQVTGEHLSSILRSTYNISVSVYRPFSVYGEDQGEESIITSLLSKVMEGKGKGQGQEARGTVISIDSNDTMDFVYVEDVVDCVLHTYPMNIASPINLATGIGTSTHGLATAMAAVAGYDQSPVVEIHEGSSLVSYRRVGSPSLAISYGCKFPTDLKKGLQIAHDYFLRKNNREYIIDASGTEMKSEPSSDGDSSGRKERVYSSHRCLGGSQGNLGTDFSPVQHLHEGFPKSFSGDYRVCHFKNVCVDPTFQINYFRSPHLDSVPDKYMPGGFEDRFFTLGFAYSSNRILKVVSHHEDSTYFDQEPDSQLRRVGYLDTNSFSYNYGHAVLDNMYPHFVASQIFGLPFRDTTHLLHSPCGILSDASPPNAPVPYDRSRTYGEKCRENIDRLNRLFFGNEAVYLLDVNLQPLLSKPVCFEDLVVGQSAAFSLKTLDLSRSIPTSNFRDFLVKQYPEELLVEREVEVVRILVAVQGGGHETSPDNTLCTVVLNCVSQYPSEFSFLKSTPIVDCIKPEKMTTIDEIKAARRSHMIISYEGTVSYVSLFAQDNTHQIVISNTLKENQVLLWMSHIHPLYVKADSYKEELCSVIKLGAIKWA